MSMTREVNRWWSLVLLGIVTWSGCSADGPAGPKTAKATGVVTYKGLPVADATVVFLGDGKTQPAQALTNNDGLFVLTTTKPGDGAVPGNHVVSVTKVVGNLAATTKNNLSMEGAVKAGEEAAKESKLLHLVPQKYSVASSSPLRFTVKEGEKNHFEIKLED